MQSKREMNGQPNLFEIENDAPEIEKILLFALGEFQSRGKVLADRELALDRLRGAFRRASEKFQTEDLADETIVDLLEKMGAKIVRKQSFVAKHPFRVTISTDLAEQAKTVYQESLNDD